ncbi:MAG: AAA family ATPase, partial [Candidatus Levyibacteriota bacterium]
LNIATRKTPGTVLYISAEESLEQVKLRSLRIAKGKPGKNFLILSISDTDAVVEAIAQSKPDLVIIDSIQTMESENVAGLAGSVGQIRYSAAQFIKTAKTLGIPIIMVGHVTKEGMVAGPMILSHMVDAVLFLEGDKFSTTRVLRSLKNRFGPVDEVGVFLMEEKGIEEIKSPEQIFLTKEKKESLPGSVLIVTLEGSRAFLVEVQALVVMSKLPLPRRVSSGFDTRRLELLLAVLQKHAGIPVYAMDVFVNVAGGLKIQDPASDLGICLAVYSSFKNIPMSKTVGIAEVGLLGELRTAPMLEKRVKEAKKLGFRNIITSADFRTLNQAFKSVK